MKNRFSSGTRRFCADGGAGSHLRQFVALALILSGLLIAPDTVPAQTGPPRGLNTLPARPLNVAYLNALRRASGTTAQKIGALNYDAVDVIALAFALLNADGSLDLTYGNFDAYRPYLVPQAHAHSRSVLMSIVGSFETVAASASLRQAFATNIANALDTYSLDGVDFDWEWPDTVDERANFTAMIQTVHATVKSRSPNYIVMFVQGPGFWLAGTDWAAVRDFSDFCFCVAYDWKNPANGPMRKPGSVQFLGLNGGTIEAAAKGAVDYIIAHGYPENKIVVGLPFYSSDNRSWFTGAPLWATNRPGYLAAMDTDALEVEFDGAWWTTPDAVKRKMDVLLDPRQSVLAGQRAVRGVGFWEFGHEDTTDPQLSDAMAEWRAGDRSVGGLTSGPPTNTMVLVDAGAAWRCLDTGVFPGALWTARTFNDSAWPAGTAPLGYGDGDEATVINSSNGRITTWFRRAFTVTNLAQIRSLTLRLLRDDGAVVYLNGTEIFRSNMPTGAVAATTLAVTAVSGAEEGTLFHNAAVDPALLLAGTNALAVEAHQSGAVSSDVSFDLQLLAQTEPASLVLVPAHATWRYLDTGTNPGTLWAPAGFNDSAWFSGRARLGYGTDGESTSLQFGANAAAKTITSYFRHAFTVSDATLFGPLQLHLQRDDGAVVWLNGAEVFRSNMPTGAITATTYAASVVGGADETNWFTATLPVTPLLTGNNVVAVEVHQATAGSSDLGLDLQLTATLQPRLIILSNGGGHLLRWPAAAGFRVWFANSLSAPVAWQLATGTPTLNGAWMESGIAAGSAARFHRLQAGLAP